ncbi:MAG: hypothetical protein R3246_17085, partial [Acidimicrobiia bacterium]|nr:hypothetical protein [Acidimicrobiia bacterium]
MASPEYSPRKHHVPVLVGAKEALVAWPLPSRSTLPRLVPPDAHSPPVNSPGAQMKNATEPVGVGNAP